jgi:hypothetical protein
MLSGRTTRFDRPVGRPCLRETDESVEASLDESVGGHEMPSTTFRWLCASRMSYNFCPIIRSRSSRRRPGVSKQTRCLVLCPPQLRTTSRRLSLLVGRCVRSVRVPVGPWATPGACDSHRPPVAFSVRTPPSTSRPQAPLQCPKGHRWEDWCRREHLQDARNSRLEPPPLQAEARVLGNNNNFNLLFSYNKL